MVGIFQHLKRTACRWGRFFVAPSGLAIFAEVGGVYGHLELELAVGLDGELAAGFEGVPAVAARQFDGQGAGDDMHDFQLAGAEFVFARGHYADGGRAFNHGETDGFDGAVEVFVDLEHLRFLERGWKSCREPF